MRSFSFTISKGQAFQLDVPTGRVLTGNTLSVYTRKTLSDPWTLQPKLSVSLQGSDTIRFAVTAANADETLAFCQYEIRGNAGIVLLNGRIYLYTPPVVVNPGGGTGGTVDLEAIQDAAAALLTNGQHTNLTAVYDDDGSRVNLAAGESHPRLVVDGNVIRKGPGGAIWKAAGVNTYVLAAGGDVAGQIFTKPDRDLLFSSLPKGSVVRHMSAARRSFDTVDQQIADLKAVVADAKAAGQYISLVLVDGNGQSASYEAATYGTAGTRLGLTWYQTNFRTTYVPWAVRVATEFRNEPTVAFLDLVNEPTLPAGATGTAITTFTTALTTMLTETRDAIRAVNPNVILGYGSRHFNQTTGTLAAWQGTQILDVVDIHDYAAHQGHAGVMQQHRSVAVTVNKPLIVSEIGVYAGPRYNPSVVDPGGAGTVDYAAQEKLLRVSAGDALSSGATAVYLWDVKADYRTDGWAGAPSYTVPRVAPAWKTWTQLDPFVRDLTRNDITGIEGWLDGRSALKFAPGTVIGGAAGAVPTNDYVLYDRGLLANFRQTDVTRAPIARGAGYQFTGSQNVFLTWANGAATTPAYDWVIVFSKDAYSGTVNEYLIGSTTNNGQCIRINGATRKLELLRKGAAVVGASTTSIEPGKVYTARVRWNQSTGAWGIEINGVQEATGTTTAASLASNAVLGAAGTDNVESFRGIFYDVIKGSQVFADRDVARIYADLLVRHDIILDAPAPVIDFAKVVHGANAATPRPNATYVLWEGSVEPTNWINGDDWNEVA